MLVRELIEKLQEMDQDAVVYFKSYYDAEYGQNWDEVSKVEQELIGWDFDKGVSTQEVFIE